jgi:hypothetical protein
LIGSFADEIEEEKAYNAAKLPLAGEFARVNAVAGNVRVVREAVAKRPKTPCNLESRIG